MWVGVGGYVCVCVCVYVYVCVWSGVEMVEMVYAIIESMHKQHFWLATIVS